MNYDLTDLTLKSYLSRFSVMYMNRYDFSQFYEISVKKLQAEGLDDLMSYAADEIARSVWEQLPNANIRNCVQIGRLVKPNIEMAIVECLQRYYSSLQNLRPYPNR